MRRLPQQPLPRRAGQRCRTRLPTRLSSGRVRYIVRGRPAFCHFRVPHCVSRRLVRSTHPPRTIDERRYYVRIWRPCPAAAGTGIGSSRKSASAKPTGHEMSNYQLELTPKTPIRRFSWKRLFVRSPKPLGPRIVHFRAHDGYVFAVRVWEPDYPVARIVCLHGIISHGGWYLSSCNNLASSGFAVHFLERRGSGINPAARGDVDRYETWLNDVEQYMSSLPPNVPRLLIGISWGGKLATAVLRRCRHLIDGLGLICPGLFALKGANAWQRQSLTLIGKTPWRTRKVAIPLQEPSLFTQDRDWQEYIRTDPLALRRITIRFALADQQLSKYATTLNESLSRPCLLMLAGKDRVIDNGLVRRFVAHHGGTMPRIVEYDDATHTFEFDPIAPTYINHLKEWAHDVVAKHPKRGHLHRKKT